MWALMTPRTIRVQIATLDGKWLTRGAVVFLTSFRDNEKPSRKTKVKPFLAKGRPITNEEVSEGALSPSHGAHLTFLVRKIPQGHQRDQLAGFMDSKFLLERSHQWSCQWEWPRPEDPGWSIQRLQCS